MPVDQQDDYYARLGVDPTIGSAELRRVWRRLAARWHPDHAGHAATASFQNISAAYEVLSDPVARAEYDRRRGIRQRGLPAASTATTSRRKAPSVTLSRLCGPLNSLIACGVAREIDETHIEIFPNAQEAATGGMIRISMRVLIRCPACAGSSGAACTRCTDSRIVEEVFSAWLALPPGVGNGTILTPSALMPGMLKPVKFRVTIRHESDPK
jgi:DnaJ-class molecular chaperone